MTTARLFQVDAFTSVPFAGNSAAVLVLEGEPDDEFGSAIGTELNQPATAVVWPAAEPGRFGLRWFTSHGELDLCGHGTLAAARVLLDHGLAGAVRALLPVPVTEMLRNDLDVMAVLDSPATVRDLELDLAALRELPVRGLIVTAVREDPAGEADIAADDTADFVSRFFQVATGAEDAVTGSAHCALGPFGNCPRAAG